MTVQARGRADQAGAGRRRRLLRAHLHHRSRRRRWRWCRSATPTACRGPPATARRCWPAARSGRSPAGSAWTSSCSTSATTPSRPATRWCCGGPATHGEPTAQQWADAARHHPLRAGHPGRRPVPRRYVGSAGVGLMSRAHRSRAPPRRTRGHRRRRSSAWRRPGRRSASRSAGRRRRRVRRRPAGRSRPRTPAGRSPTCRPRLRAGRPARRRTPQPPTAPRWCRPTTACCWRSRRSARWTRR